MLNVLPSLSDISCVLRPSGSKSAIASSASVNSIATAKPSTVNISDQGRAIAFQAATRIDDAEQARPFEEVKMFCAIPKWYAEMMPALYAECGEGDNLNTPERKAWFENVSSEASRVAYLEKLQDYYQKFLTEEGITSREQHYKVDVLRRGDMVEDDGNSARMHEKFREIILGDKRMIELANAIKWPV